MTQKGKKVAMLKMRSREGGLQDLSKTFKKKLVAVISVSPRSMINESSIQPYRRSDPVILRAPRRLPVACIPAPLGRGDIASWPYKAQLIGQVAAVGMQVRF